MEPVHLLAFPIQPVSNPIRLPTAKTLVHPFSLTHYPVDWSSDDPKRLSEALNSQIKNNYTDFSQLDILCRNPAGFEQVLYTTNFVEGTQELVKNYYKSPEQKAEQCKKFLQRFHGLVDVLERDQDVFNQRTWNVQTYAIVVLYKGEYFGHIYTWVSPVDPSLCFAMGIRGRVDSVFIEDNLQNLSHYLLEGVRRFALAKGCSSIVVTHPLDTMKSILTRLGFRGSLIPRTTIGESLGGERKHFHGAVNCLNCYHSDLNRSFTGEIPVVFEF